MTLLVEAAGALSGGVDMSVTALALGRECGPGRMPEDLVQQDEDRRVQPNLR